MKKEVVSHHRAPRSLKQLNRLGIFLACLTFAAAATAFSIWYNLNKVSTEKEGLMDFIRQHFEAGFQEIDTISNR